MDNTSLKSLVKEKEIHETYEVASKEDIEKTENDLNYKLPKSYCDFVSQFSNGAFLYMIQEVSAVGDGILDNFNEWLKVLINNREEVIRTLYDDNVISMELGLG